MRRSHGIGMVFMVGLLAFGQDTSAQMMYPGGYGRYGWGGWGADPASGYMAGIGSLARGKGAYEVSDAKARSINVDTVIKWNKALRARQKELAVEAKAKGAKDAAARNARVARAELEDGQALNDLLGQILDADPAATTASKAKDVVSGADLREVPFEWNSEAITLCIDQMTVSEALPELLAGEQFDAQRKALGSAVKAALKEDEAGEVSPAATKAIGSALADFRRELAKHYDDASEGYYKAETYLTTLASIGKLLNDPSMKKALAALDTAKETTVGHLIAFMQAYNLRFGPAVDARQVEIYGRLAGLLGEVATAVKDAPAPPVTGDTLALPAAATEAFKSMSWSNIEAHRRAD